MMPSPAFRAVLVALALGSAAAFGCYTGPAVDTTRIPDPQVAVAGAEPASQGPGGADPSAPPPTPRGLPCEVAALVAANCMQCHGAVPSGGAQNRLLTYEDFTGTPSDPGYASVAELSLARMNSATRPMPPIGHLDKTAIAAFSRWVKQGLPRGTCGEAQADGGTVLDAPDAGGSPAGPAFTCTSGVRTPYEEESEFMRPGRTCIDCHSVEDGPPFEVAGTVYPTLHEPADCHGTTGVKVMIIDAAGTVHTLTTNAAGNFFLDSDDTKPFPRPYRALVVHDGNLREMQTPQMDGDCNGCHTESGIGADGRISLP